jgi:hypothetical protein
VLDPARAPPRLLAKTIRVLLDNASVGRRAAELRDRIEPSRGLELLADILDASDSAAKSSTVACARRTLPRGEAATAG